MPLIVDTQFRDSARKPLGPINFQASYPLNKNKLSDYKEVFWLFDKNGVLSLLYYSSLLDIVTEVSADTLNNTIEFNEFLKIMRNKENEEIGEILLLDAFK